MSDGTLQRPGEFVASNRRVARRLLPLQLIGFDLSREQVLQPSPSRMVLPPCRVVRPRAAITLAKMVQRQTPRHDDQPGGERRLAIWHVRAQPSMVVLAQRTKDERIRVHGGVILPRDCATRMQYYAAVRGDEFRPRRVPLRAFARDAETRERKR